MVLWRLLTSRYIYSYWVVGARIYSGKPYCFISGDKKTIEQITALIVASCPDIGIDATANELKKGVSTINLYQPDLLILDTYLTDGSGFDLLNHFENPDFKIIFISEYAEYALKAIEYNASGYLLKPINEKKLTTSVNNVKNRIEKEKSFNLGY